MARELPKDIFDITVVLKTLGIVWECSKKHTIIRITLVVIMAILPLIPLYLFKLLLDAFATGQSVNFNDVLWILVSLGVVKLATIFVSNIAAYNNSIQGDIVTDHMSKILITKSLDIDMEYFDSDQYHDQFHRAMGQGGTKPLNVLGGVTSFFQNVLTLIAIIGLLFSLHWSITFILFIITLPVAIVRFIYSEKLVELQKNQTQPSRIAGYYRSVLTGMNSAQEVRIFNFGKNLLNKFLSLANNLRLERRALYLQQVKWVSIAQSAEVIAIMAALGFIVYKAIQGNLTVGDISMYYLAFQKGQGNLSGIMSSAISIHQQKLMLNYLFEFLGMEPMVENAAKPVSFPQTIEKLEVKNLSFIYPGTKKVVLDKVSFEANKGDIIAIVGENGSGKTTLIKIINRLYDPTSGHVLYNDTDYKDFDIFDIRKNISVIFQKFATYAFTVSENISLSNIFQKHDPNKIKEAARLAQADTFIESLPQKYQSNLGRIFKDGNELSKGQWQKIALSRAFYKDAEIIILDEPTSFIDPLAEDKIFHNFRKIAHNKIVILITHRIYNLKMANTILVMEKGKLVETGNHSDLMAQNGIYKEMFEKQEVD